MAHDPIVHHPATRPDLDDAHTTNTDPGDPVKALGGLGDQDHPLSVSPPLNGIVTLWTPHGRYRWSAHDPQLLSAILGHGPIDGHWHSWTLGRDTVTVNAHGALQVLVPETCRDPAPSGATVAFSYRILPLAGELIDSTLTAATDEDWNEFGWWIGDVVEHAFDRGDDVIVEHMTSVMPKRACTLIELSAPQVRIATYQGGRRPRRAPVETKVPLSRAFMTTVGNQAAEAVSRWANSPLDTRVSFRPARSPVVMGGHAPRNKHWQQILDHSARTTRIDAGNVASTRPQRERPRPQHDAEIRQHLPVWTR